MSTFDQNAAKFGSTNQQKQAYYTPPFWKPAHIPHEPIPDDSDFADDIAALADVPIIKSYIERTDLVVWIAPEHNFQAMQLLQARGYETLSEMSAIDYIAQKGGFELFYQLLCYTRKTRLRLRCFLPLGQEILSVCSLFGSANWSEREMYDMFGIVVRNHPYLKRLLMPHDWQGHPLRKTYPLQGDEAAQWYEVDKIFGKEYREIIGAEQRDPAHIDRYDSTRFGRIDHEVSYGAPVDDNAPTTSIHYQEESGIPLVDRFTPERAKTLEEER